MSEGSASVAITQHINAGHIRTKLTVNLDVAAPVHLNARVFKAEIIRVRHATDFEKHMRADDSRIAALAIKPRDHAVAAFFKADAGLACANNDRIIFSCYARK